MSKQTPLRARLAEPDAPAPDLFRVNMLRLCPALTHEQIDLLATQVRPVARKVQPLTMQALIDLMPSTVDASFWFCMIWYARDIERAHGITGDSHD